MNQHRSSGAPSRRTMLRHAATAGVVVSGTITGAGSLFAEAMSGRGANGPLRPVEAIPAILAAMQRYPLVAMTERHMLQEWHDLITALLFHPDLPGTINDIVVEFGNAAYQDLADRFVLGDRPVARADLAQIWRQIGDPTWNAPIYEQF